MGLVAREAARAQLLEREHQLDRVERPDDARELRRREAAGEPHELVARDVDVDQLAGELEVGERHRLGRDLEIEAVRDEEAVDHVEVGGVAAVHAPDDAVDDDQLGLGIVRPVRRDQAELGHRRDDQLAAQLLLGARAEAVGVLRRQGALARRTRRWPRARTRRSRLAPQPSSWTAHCSSSLGGRAVGAERGVDGEQLVVRDARELGRALEVLGERGAPARARDRRLSLQASRAWRGSRGR